MSTYPDAASPHSMNSADRIGNIDGSRAHEEQPEIYQGPIHELAAPLEIPSHLLAFNEMPEDPDEDKVDGGVVAWLQVAGCFCLYWNSLGIINSFGVFQTYYQTDLLKEASPSAISWIGSIQAFCLLSITIFIGPLYDAGFYRALLIIGSFLVVFGLMMTSLCTSYAHVMLAHGVCVGLGTSCLSIPSIAIVPCYFKALRARAMGLATVGSCVGATIYPLLFQTIRPKLGFPWTMRILGFISLVMCGFSFLVLRPRQPNIKRFTGVTSLIDRSAFESSSYVTYTVGIFFSNVAWFVPVFYLEAYAMSHGMSDSQSKYLVTIFNAASIPGRIILAVLSDIFGCVNTFVFITVSTAAVVYSWVAVHDAAGNFVFAVMYGFFSGSLVAIAPIVLASFTTDLSRFGTRLGMVNFLKGIGSLIGTPIAGSIIGHNERYLGAQLFPAASFTLTFIFMCFLRVNLGREKGIGKILKGGF